MSYMSYSDNLLMRISFSDSCVHVRFRHYSVINCTATNEKVVFLYMFLYILDKASDHIQQACENVIHTVDVKDTEQTLERRN